MPFPVYGVAAIKQGFDSSNSMYHFDRVTSKYLNHRQQFKDYIKSYSGKGMWHNRFFSKNPTVPNNYIQQLNEIVQLAKKENIDIILFFPPLAPPILSLTKSLPDYKYINDLINKTAHLNIYNFHDPNVINSTKCEFLDGIHGGDVTMAKMLLYIKDSVVKSKLSNNLIQQIKLNEGLAQMKNEYSIYFTPEIDFLNIGCSKKNAFQPK